MLSSLHIKNFALIDDLETRFTAGLNIITGETGAGKSIIIGALGFLLGERADASSIRKGEEKAMVEGAFEIKKNRKVLELLAEEGIEATDELIVRREFSIKGTGRCFMNDSPATLALLKKVGDALVDLHGQHEHQSLLRSETHVDMVDEFAGNESLRLRFANGLRAVNATIREINELRAREATLRERRDLLDFQLKEIDAVRPEAGEEGKLDSEFKILQNAEVLHTATEEIYQILYEGENAVTDRLVAARNRLEGLIAIDTEFAESKKELDSAAAIIAELAKAIHAYQSRIEFNPERLEEIQTRQSKLIMLKKKYGGSIEAVLAHRAKIAGEIGLAENFDAELAKLRERLNAERGVCADVAGHLSVKRLSAGKKIDKSIIETLAELGIARARFETRIAQEKADESDESSLKIGKAWCKASMSGMDAVEFFISTNVGEDLKPLARVASGGEVSRVMLALKKVLSVTAELPVMIFDEIDTGVSGRIAQDVGACMKSLAGRHQVIAITHLPQIVGFADAHYVVEKVETKGRAVTGIRTIVGEERVREVARLLSGADITKSALASAKELIAVSTR